MATKAGALLPGCLLLGLAAGPARGGEADKRLDVYWIDVEGGAATLLVTPAGESVLIDTGNPGGRDPGRIVKLAAETAGLKKIDHVVVTHLHGDHYGGLADLATRLPVGTLWENGVDSAPERERNDPKVVAYRAATVGQRAIVQPGAELPLEQAEGAAPIALRFLGARQKFVDPARGRAKNPICRGASTKAPDTSDNANSVVLLVSFGPFRFFDGGDLTWNREADLACPVDRVGPVDVYQSDHHGLDQSGNPVLVHTLRPMVAVFNNGPRKGCEPASFETVKKSPGIQAIYQVHRNLAAPAANTADAMIANQKDPCGAEPIKLSVDPKGRTYTVTVPSTGHSRTFKTRGK